LKKKYPIWTTTEKENNELKYVEEELIKLLINLKNEEKKKKDEKKQKKKKEIIDENEEDIEDKIKEKVLTLNEMKVSIIDFCTEIDGIKKRFYPEGFDVKNLIESAPRKSTFNKLKRYIKLLYKEYAKIYKKTTYRRTRKKYNKSKFRIQ